MESQTELGQVLDIAAQRAGYDAACKAVLSQRVILARILKKCVEEYKDCTPEEIAGYIEKDPIVGKAEVARGRTNAAIAGNNTEDATLNEGTVRYDVLFTSVLPGSDETIGLIINIEAQRSSHPGYSIHSRAAYYCARLLASQFGAELKGADYGKLKRVYSIWICSGFPKEHQNSINEYKMTECNREGKAFGNHAGSDLMRIELLTLGDPSTASDLLRMLDVLFSSMLDSQEKKAILSKEFNLPMTEEFDQGVNNMCNFSDGVFEEGMQKGIEKGQLEAVRNLMKSLNCTVERALELLAIPLSERPRIMEQIG